MEKLFEQIYEKSKEKKLSISSLRRLKLAEAINNNGSGMVCRIQEIGLNRFKKHIEENTFVILSAFTNTCTEEENIARTKVLKKKLQDLRLSFIPFYGGYTMDSGDFSYENFFVVFCYNFDKQKYVMTDQELYMLALDLIQFAPGQSADVFDENAEHINVESFGQEAFFFKRLNKPAIFIRQDSKIDVNIPPMNSISFNDLTKGYFTALNKLSGTRKSKKSFVLTERYINRPFSLPSEAELRSRSGEVSFFEKLY